MREKASPQHQIKSFIKISKYYWRHQNEQLFGKKSVFSNTISVTNIPSHPVREKRLFFPSVLFPCLRKSRTARFAVAKVFVRVSEGARIRLSAGGKEGRARGQHSEDSKGYHNPGEKGLDTRGCL